MSREEIMGWAVRNHYTDIDGKVYRSLGRVYKTRREARDRLREDKAALYQSPGDQKTVVRVRVVTEEIAR